MKQYRFGLQLMIIFLLILSGPTEFSFAKGQQKGAIQLPSSVVNIAKENTVPNEMEDLIYLKPSNFTKELFKSSNEAIDNPNLIRILNESSINKSPLSIGMRATIYMGEWPLNYKSAETIPNWQYQKINTNVYDNTAGKINHQINYVQQVQKRVKGGLTGRVPHSEDVQKMMLIKAMEKTNLPVATETVIGAGTKHSQIYNVHPKRVGYLHAYVPALIEKGEVTYGEVYLVIRGTQRKIAVKNVTSQKIGAWLPIQDHLSFSFTAN
ncbi:YfkD famly protein [Lederbergia citri]|uniref:YfkD family protein n=1 Tax=Lederbergia citri TaxID=2833580 RepID=A0A942TJM8_9BACI|nr:YfkD famly protein [Lederbergia citri]MBS4197529.1 YfkD family protein [Lederbergia citri]